VTYRDVPVEEYDVPVEEYASWLQEAGLDEASAHVVAALDASISHGDLKTDSQDLAHLLGRPATPLADVVRAARGSVFFPYRGGSPIAACILGGSVRRRW